MSESGRNFAGVISFGGISVRSIIARSWFEPRTRLGESEPKIHRVFEQDSAALRVNLENTRAQSCASGQPDNGWVLNW